MWWRSVGKRNLGEKKNLRPTLVIQHLLTAEWGGQACYEGCREEGVKEVEEGLENKGSEKLKKKCLLREAWVNCVT